MEKICRFCLKVSTKSMCSLQECDILYSIQKFLTIKIPTEHLFPSNICKECFKKTSQLINFCITVKDNEDNLQYYLRNGQLQDYYSKITNNIQQEDDHKDLKIETSYVDVEYDTKSICEDYNHLKNEDFFENGNKTPCSSIDEAGLATVKKENEINIIAPLKKITKFRPIKCIIPKRKKKKEQDDNKYVKPFTCLTCLIECNSKPALTKHYYSEHFLKNTGNKNYTEHKSEDKTTYSCDRCDKTYNLKKDIVKHSMTHTSDNDERPLICKLCARTYRRVSDIVRHSRAHNGLKLECPFNCGYTTAYQGAMKEHKNMHLDEYKYTCKTCGKGFNIKTWYEQHQNIHTGHKPFVCNICGNAFPLARYLQNHKSTAHPKSSSAKRFQCPHCDEKWGCSKSLAVHVLEKHGIKKETDSLCDYCGKIVVSESQLQYHHRMHLGVKPYSCNLCKKRFAKKYNLQLHMTIHTGDNAHICVHCGKKYSQRSSLLKHLKSCPADDTSQ